MYEGELVRLRAYEPEDLERVYTWFNDREVTRHLLIRLPPSRADQRAWLERAGSPSESDATFAVEVRADGRHIGGVDLRVAPRSSRTAELGLALGDRSAWGRGFGTDTVRTVCRFGFEELDLARIELWVAADNAAAQRVYEKVGFVREGTARSRHYQEGRRHDEHLYGLLPGERR